MAKGILVIGPRWVGDMVMAQCLLSALKELYPASPIDVMAPAWAAPLISRMPEARARIDAPFKAGEFGLADRFKVGRSLSGRYGRAYVLPGSWKSALVPFFAGIPTRVGFLRELRYGLLNAIVPLPRERKRRTAEMFHLLADGGAFRPPHLAIDAANQATLLAAHGLEAGGYAALMPGAEFGPAKRWPEDKYAGLARHFADRGLKTILLGSAKDREVGAAITALVPEAIDLTGQTRLEDAIDLLGAARIAVANDSGLMHVAAAVGVPVVGVYGSTSYENTPPLTDRRELISLHLACSPCHKRECPLGHLNCLKTLDVAMVSGAADRLLALPS
ncbi:lipopolysaccharide heptosyltransferase II [Pleomorphomonas diazotrophica]|uniref:lipopolysaccharide heptosyltransferase II n=1 Tax=Pleomorphomonas diazotrophica TaxID=1166257 RepID=A0A1I4UHC7_9HYPH|nr:lipopolysaccharide heptosyltransferase II [Pleomorphomonas diazotrophica]PKR89192.1 lipopolysaccharide heptosyltransferase II [Pleomorphomonas diazotrophica]SFM88251.1 heptosyltransferase-2 [Pleomorphomonas diazotrophica]